MLNNVKIIFFHIEKCMGSSFRIMLNNYFKKFFNESEILLPENYKNRNIISIDDYNYYNKLSVDFKVLLCHIYYKNNITLKLCNNIFSISCVRNPYNRIISHYYYFDYSKYNKNLYELNNTEMISILKNYGNLIFNKLGDKNRINEFNCILVMENINTELEILNNLLNKKYRKNINLKLLNMNNNKKYNNSLQFDMIYLEKYEQYFKKDIELYNYILSLPIDKRFKL